MDSDSFGLKHRGIFIVMRFHLVVVTLELWVCRGHFCRDVIVINRTRPRGSFKQYKPCDMRGGVKNQA
jgi:hypothetical protein